MNAKIDYAATIPTDRTEWTEDYAELVVAAYIAADKGQKATMRTAWKTVYNQAVRDMSVDDLSTIGHAKFAQSVSDRLVTKKDLDTTDPIVAYRVRYEALREAYRTVRADYIESRKVTDGDTYNIDDVTLTFDNYELSEDDAKSSIAMGEKLATVSGVNRRSGANRSIIGHVKFCLDSVPVGTILTSSQIAAIHTDDYPATDSASEGAIGAYWIRATDSETRDKSAQPGIRYTENEKGVRGFALVETPAPATDDETATD